MYASNVILRMPINKKKSLIFSCYFSEELIALTVLPFDSNPLPTDYETRALTNAPPGISNIVEGTQAALKILPTNRYLLSI